jgi:ABC-type polysaccharide/polyol phosphate transport system ATPase subunit
MSIAVSVEHLSKEYRLGTINHGTLFRDMQSWIARKSGKPDPHEKIGAMRFEDQEDRFWALKDVSFKIGGGDRIGVIGQNGAGKSTLLKVLSRITEPTEGTVKIKGRVASLLEVGTGFHPELTGRDNIFLTGAIRGMKKREIARRLDEIIAFSEISKFIDTPVKRYSSGMYVRLAFAVAAHLDSEIILADEVLAVGDQAFQDKCLGKMEDVSVNLGRTVFFVSHNLGAVGRLCKSGVILERGRVKAEGEIGDMIKCYLADAEVGEVHFDEGLISEARVVQDGSSILVEASYRPMPHIDVPCLTIRVSDGMGQPVFTYNPRNYPFAQRDPRLGDNRIVARIAQPVLHNGVYYLTLFFGDSKKNYTTHRNCLKVEIRDMTSIQFSAQTSGQGPVCPVAGYSYS